MEGIEKAIDELGLIIVEKEKEIKALQQKIKLIEQYIEFYEDYIRGGDR